MLYFLERIEIEKVIAAKDVKLKKMKLEPELISKLVVIVAVLFLLLVRRNIFFHTQRVKNVIATFILFIDKF